MKRGWAAVLPLLVLSACGTSNPSLVAGPVMAAPPKAPMYLERPNNGSIYQAGMATGSLFSGERKPQAVGDKLKVDISESLQASQKQSTDTSRDNKAAVKGPGTGSHTGGLFNSILNANAAAAGSDSYKGNGSTEANSSFTTQLAVTVINVLPNGHLVVAGERSMGLNGNSSTLRFSGSVDPRDIRPGNVVSSRDVVNASLESVGQGDVSDAASRTWLQRVLTRSMSIW